MLLKMEMGYAILNSNNKEIYEKKYNIGVKFW